MKKQMDKLKNKIKTNKKISIFLFILTIVGIMSGALFVTILSQNDQMLVKEYLHSYMTNMENGQIKPFTIFSTTFFNHIFVIVLIWVLGISIVGIPIILFLFFSKIFTLGFSIGSIFYVYQLKGLLLAIVYVFPHQVINLIGYGLLVTYAILVSIKLLKAVLKKTNIDFKIIMGKYSIILGISILIIVLCSLYESFGMPKIMQFISTLIKK